MVHAASRKLIFRLGKTGFLLDLDWVVEICEQFAGQFDASRTDLDQGIVGSFYFRQTNIPVVDPCLHLNSQSELAITEKTALILRGGEGNWTLLVDRVEEILPATMFQSCEIPPLLKKSITGYYSEISLLMNEPMINFEPEQYYGAAPVFR